MIDFVHEPPGLSRRKQGVRNPYGAPSKIKHLHPAPPQSFNSLGLRALLLAGFLAVLSLFHHKRLLIIFGQPTPNVLFCSLKGRISDGAPVSDCAAHASPLPYHKYHLPEGRRSDVRAQGRTETGSRISRGACGRSMVKNLHLTPRTWLGPTCQKARLGLDQRDLNKRLPL